MNIRCLSAGLAIAAVATTAAAQSATTLAGMQAYNRGDVPTAYRLLREEAGRGDPVAQVNLGYLYARGQGVREDQKEAMRLYLLAAEQGDSEGMNAAGYKYLFGTGIERNPGRAVYWFCMSIAKGNPRGMNNLALILNAGEFAMRDEEEARRLWLQSANLGHQNSMFNLALSYTRGANPDLAKGRAWTVRAAQSGHPEAQRILRGAGYTGPLPQPFQEGGAMIAAPKNEAGHSKVCGASVS